jgi:protein-S-isoprenylcysteine O-methyltransferase Ste14
LSSSKSRVRIRPPFIAGFYLFIAWGLHALFPGLAVIDSPYNLLGFIVIVAGFVLAVWALLVFKDKGTPHHPFATPKALVTTGPFRFSRSPMYLGVTGVLAGIAIYVGSLLMFLAPLAFLATMNAAFVPREEATLERLFGEDYLDYRNRVRRWL